MVHKIGAMTPMTYNTYALGGHMRIDALNKSDFGPLFLPTRSLGSTRLLGSLE